MQVAGVHVVVVFGLVAGVSSAAGAKTYRGRVVDGATDKGLEDVEIYPLDKDGKPLTTTPAVSVAEGRYEVACDKKPANIRFIKNGYLPRPANRPVTESLVRLWQNTEDDEYAFTLARKLKAGAEGSASAVSFYKDQERYLRSTVSVSPVLLTKVANELTTLETADAGSKLTAFKAYAGANPKDVAAFQKRFELAIKEGGAVPGPLETQLDPKVVSAIAAYEVKANADAPGVITFRDSYAKLWEEPHEAAAAMKPRHERERIRRAERIKE
jgi:hypothetical protein